MSNASRPVASKLDDQLWAFANQTRGDLHLCSLSWDECSFIIGLSGIRLRGFDKGLSTWLVNAIPKRLSLPAQRWSTSKATKCKRTAAVFRLCYKSIRGAVAVIVNVHVNEVNRSFAELLGGAIAPPKITRMNVNSVKCEKTKWITTQSCDHFENQSSRCHILLSAANTFFMVFSTTRTRTFSVFSCDHIYE